MKVSKKILFNFEHRRTVCRVLKQEIPIEQLVWLEDRCLDRADSQAISTLCHHTLAVEQTGMHNG